MTARESSAKCDRRSGRGREGRGLPAAAGPTGRLGFRKEGTLPSR